MLDSANLSEEENKYLLRNYSVIGILFDLYFFHFTVRKLSLRELKSLVQVT